jgi:hypothetical protein
MIESMRGIRTPLSTMAIPASATTASNRPVVQPGPVSGLHHRVRRIGGPAVAVDAGQQQVAVEPDPISEVRAPQPRSQHPC